MRLDFCYLDCKLSLCNRGCNKPKFMNKQLKYLKEMARYTGPKSRIARKFGEGIFGADKVLSKKNYPPGQHGNSRKRKTSEYGVQTS